MERLHQLSDFLGRQTTISKSLCALLFMPFATLAAIAIVAKMRFDAWLAPIKSAEQRTKFRMFVFGLSEPNEKTSANYGSQKDWGFIRSQLTKMYTAIMYERAFVGLPAPDVPLVDFETRQQVSLLSYQQFGRPLLVNFGSCS